VRAACAVSDGMLREGLAHNVRVKRAVTKDTIISFNDVELINDLDVVTLRRDMENKFRPGKVAAA
jgi:predicted homoserine dehydrogenase-like protein